MYELCIALPTDELRVKTLSLINVCLLNVNFFFDCEEFAKLNSCMMQVLLGANQGMNQCSLLPGVMMGREAGRPGVVWQIYSSATFGGGHRFLT